MLQACSKHYRPNRLGRVLFMGARGRFAFGRSRPRPSIRKGCLRLAQSGRRKAGRMAAPAGKLTTTAPFFIGGILRRIRRTTPWIAGIARRRRDRITEIASGRSLLQAELVWRVIRPALNSERRPFDLHGLRELVGQGDQHADFAFAYGAPEGPRAFVSTVKLRQAGFTKTIDTEDSFRNALQSLIDHKLLPPAAK